MLRFGPVWLLLRRETGNVAAAYLKADQLANDDADLKRDLEVIFAAASRDQDVADLLNG